jgi:hypothetical protein
MPHRVIQWSTGNVGVLAVKAIVEHPDLELAGLIVHSPKKHGQDAGVLAGIGPIGVLASSDIDAMLASDADTVCYTAAGDMRPDGAVDDIERALLAGKNVVSTSVVSLCYPPAADPAVVTRLTDACTKAGVSCFTSGIDPGFATDLLPLVFSGFCSRVDRIHVQEIFDYGTYNSPEVMFDLMGFSQPMDATPPVLLPGALAYVWGPIIQMVADKLGAKLDRIDEWSVKSAATERLDTASGPIEAGTCGGLRFQIRGIIGGEERIVVEHITRMRDDQAPDWPRASDPEGGYKMMLTGDPSYNVEFAVHGADGVPGSGGLLATAMRVINAIPAVVAAPPGLLSALDLPLITGPLTGASG